MMTQRILGLCLIAAFMLTGCARDISSSTYNEDEAMVAVKTYQGKIINVRSVKVAPKSEMGDNSTGLLAGGAGGALAGDYLGNHNPIGMLAGAAIGAIAGSYAEKGIKGTQQGLEYTVKLTDGQLMTITQGPEPHLQKGQKVLVQISLGGRSRVVALS